MITNQLGTIRVYLTSAVTTNELDVTGHYVAMSTSGVVSNVAQIAINTTGTTPLIIMPATLAAGTVGILKNLQVYNADTVAQTVIIDQYDGTTARVMASIPLNPGQSLQINADGDLTIIPPTPAGGGSGTVTSVSGTGTVSGITLTGLVTTTGSLTLGGTLAVTPSNFASQSANTFLAAPDGAAGVPTFRAIANNDMPNDGVIAKVLTGFTSGAGTVTASDSILSAIQKLDGNNANITNENLLINSGFLVNQRAVSGTVTLAAGAYGHDMWKGGASGCTYTFSSSNGVTTLTISAGSLQQIVESSNVPGGTNTLALSWTGTAQGKIGAGSFSASGVTGSVTGGSNLTIEFNTGTLSQVKLELNKVTAYQKTKINDELAACKRYYQKMTLLYTVTRSGAATQFLQTVFPVEFRATPTATYTGFIDQDSSGCTAMTLGALSASQANTLALTGTITATSRLLVNVVLSAEL